MFVEIQDLLDQIATRQWGITELNMKIKELKIQNVPISNIVDATIGSAPWYKVFRIIVGGQTFSIRLPRYNIDNGQKTTLFCKAEISPAVNITHEVEVALCQILKQILT